MLSLCWLLLVTEPSFAEDEIQAVESGQTIQVEGPSVCMTEAAFRRYVTDSRELSICREGLDRALTAITDRDAKLAQLEFQRALQQNRHERNLAIGVSGGFLLGVVTSALVVISIN